MLIGGSYIACEVAASLTALGQALHDGDARGRAALDAASATPAGALLRRRARRARDRARDRRRRWRASRATSRVAARRDASRARARRRPRRDGHRRDARRDARPLGRARAGGDAAACAARRRSRPRRRASGRAGDMCEYDSVVHGRRLRIEHWEVAAAQGQHAARGDARRAGGPTTRCPYFWSDLADWASLEYVGPGERSGTARSCAARSTTASSAIFYLDGGRLAGALTVGRSDDLRAATADRRRRARRPRDALGDSARTSRRSADGAGRSDTGLRDRRRRGLDALARLGGLPRRSQPPSGRRSIAPRAISWPSAVVTDGRRAPTMPASVRCGRRSETSTPPGTTRPQRSARQPQQRQQAVVDAREVRDRLHDDEPLGAARGAVHSAAKISGHCAARTASAWSTIATRALRRRGPLDRARQQHPRRRGRPRRAAGRRGRAARRTGGRRRSPRARAGRRARAARSAGCRRSATAAASSGRAGRRSRG